MPPTSTPNTPAPAPSGPPSSAGPNRFDEASRFFARLHRYQIVFRKFWWTLPLAIGLCLGAVTLYTSKLPPLYESKSKVWLRGRLTLPEGRGFNEELSAQVELMQSASVENRAIRSLQESHPEWNLTIITNDPLAEPPFELTVKEVPKAGVFELSAVGANPEATRLFLDAVMAEYLAFREGERAKSSDIAQNSFTNRIEELETSIAEAQEKARRYQVDNQLMVSQEQGSSAASYLARISRQLSALRMENDLLEKMDPQTLAELSARMMDETGVENLPGNNASREVLRAVSTAEVDSYRASQQLSLLKAKRDELANVLRPAHPKMVQLEKSVADQMKILEVFETQGRNQLANRKTAIKLQISSMEKAYQEWELKAAEASVKLAEYERLQTEIARLQNYYTRLIGTVQSVDVNRGLQQESFSVLDPASVARPVNRARRFQLLGLIAGTFLGLGALYLIEQFDDRFSSVNELRAQMSELVIGQIPELGRRRSKGRVATIQPHDTRHEFNEAFLNLRSALLFTFTEANRPRTILVTSSVPEEGKSTVAANLATMLAMSGARVVLIDADLRRATQHLLFSLEQSPGCAELLSQQATLEQVAHNGTIENLTVIPGGSGDVNPGSLFLRESTNALLADLAQKFDYVIVDSAPVMVRDDTANIAPKVDGVLFVVRGGFTSARIAGEALDMLRQRKARVLGLVFNRAVTSFSESLYGSYHSYKYYRTPGTKKKKK